MPNGNKVYGLSVSTHQTENGCQNQITQTEKKQQLEPITLMEELNLQKKALLYSVIMNLRNLLILRNRLTV